MPLPLKKLLTIGSTLKGFSWNLAGNFIRSISGFFINIVLARLLGPEPFGVMALALLIISIGNLIIESGLGSALVQKEKIEKNDISFVFTMQMGFSICLTALIIIFAPLLEFQFSITNATPVIRVMSLILVLQAVSQVPSALLRREQNFKSLQIAQITSFFVGYFGFGLFLALYGLGVWSLVIAQLVQSGLNAVIVYKLSSHPLTLTINGSRRLSIFGINILIANVASWIIQNVDNMVIGRVFGAKSLGFYSRAYLLNWTPAGIVIASAQASIFSAVSRLGKGSETIRIFYGFMSAFAIFFFSGYWLIALESKNIIEIIYGQAWLPTATLLLPIAVAMPFLTLAGLEGPILIGMGKPEYEIRAQWLTVFFALPVLITASRISLVVTAWSIPLIYIFRLLVMSVMTIRVLEISWKQLMRSILSGIIMGVFTIISWTLSNFFNTTQLPILITTLIRISVVTFCWLIFFVYGPNGLFLEIKSFLNFYLKNATSEN